MVADSVDDECDDDQDEARHHVVDKTHADGVKLDRPIAWCGAELWQPQWMFLDAQHFISSLRSQSYAAWNGCRACAEALSAVLVAALDDAVTLRQDTGRGAADD